MSSRIAPMTPSPFLRAALRYADLGYAVFPCVPEQKNPLTAHGLLDATTDHMQSERWWTENPSANIAIRTDGLLVVDVDGENNPWLGEQDERWQDLAVAPSSRTPRGGRHFWFRQPPGKAWRCAQGQLAHHVDTRANGGYIVASPSSVDGRAYRWLEGYELEVSPDQLPEPPAWLVEQLDEMATKPVTALDSGGQNNRIPVGRRNGILTSLAGTMRRVGMTQVEIEAALQQVNTDRCAPPLEGNEVNRIAASVASYAPDEVAAAVANGRLGDMPDYQIALPLSVRELVAKYPDLREPVVHGLLRRGETMNVISLPKLGKSWLVLDLSLSVAAGRTWLDTYQTEPGDVLILDNELHGETSPHRIPKVAAARGIPTETVADHLFVLNLRGHLRDVYTLRPIFENLEAARFKVIILDAFYRFMPREMDENDNGTMASLYNHLDAYADRLSCCFVLIHHTTKGNQSAKSVTDVGAGAGSQSRATDTHLVLRAHEQPGAVVLDAAARSWAPIEPIVLRWSFPTWTRADDLNPALLRGVRPPKTGEKKAEPDKPRLAEWTVERFVKEFISQEPVSKAELREATKDTPGLSCRRVADLTEIAESKGLIHVWRVGRGHRVVYATAPQPKAEETGS